MFCFLQNLYYDAIFVYKYIISNQFKLLVIKFIESCYDVLMVKVIQL